MKSDLTALRLTPTLTVDAFQAFFEALEHPAALCDARLKLLTTNSAFDGLCGVKVSPGQDLGEVLKEVAGEVPPDGDARDVEVTLSSGQEVTLTLSRKGDTIAVVARNLAQAAAVGSLAAAGRAIVEHARVEQTLLELGREVAGSASEEELVAVVARGVKALFPGRSFCVRIADQRTLQLTSLYAEGRLADGASDVMVFKRSAAEKTNLRMHLLHPDRVKVIDEEVPLMFQGTGRSLCAPLVASGQLFGVINVEYPQGMSVDLVADNQLLIQLANQVAVGIRNAKLIDELTFVRKYLEELLEHANALILVASRERRVVVFNKNISHLTGLHREEVLGQDLLSFIPESEKMRVMRVIAASLRGEQVSNFETRLLGKGGKEVRVSFATSAVLTARGEVEGVIAIGQDLTVVKELEKRVIQAEKLASLGQLAASVVHEINNPMTAVATYADALLQRYLLNPAADLSDRDKLKKIIDNSNRILRFTRDLVSYARPADDKPEKVDLHKLLDMAVSFCDHVLHQHKVAVEKEYGSLPPLSAVRGNLVQVFVNLITNACHAMQPGGVVKLRTVVDGNDALITVADSGAGIKAEHLDKIFEPFFTTKPDGKGTGLGLSIVQGIVEKHAGTIKVNSVPGQGTTFSIRLPLPE
ncbi:MAG TPA: ATP-binding protein [Myxococcales bacterium]|nr:ATP-binding protein [Myxococcales bacterium]